MAWVLGPSSDNFFSTASAGWDDSALDGARIHSGGPLGFKSRTAGGSRGQEGLCAP